jgi:hypothetical protein
LKRRAGEGRGRNQSEEGKLRYGLIAASVYQATLIDWYRTIADLTKRRVLNLLYDRRPNEGRTCDTRRAYQCISTYGAGETRHRYGALRAGEQLTAIRKIAEELVMNPNTVARRIGNRSMRESSS